MNELRISPAVTVALAAGRPVVALESTLITHGFAAPLNPANAVYPPDTVNPPLTVLGESPLSCTADEIAPPEVEGGGATKCLRLTSGPINVGDGPFLKRFTFADDLAAGSLDTTLLRGKARQEILWSDGTSTQRDATGSINSIGWPGRQRRSGSAASRRTAPSAARGH